MSEYINDPMTMYAIAFVIFCLLAYRYGRGAMLNWLDGEIKKVRAQLDEAQKLRAEAEKTLEEYKEQQAAALADAAELVANAKADAARLKEQAEADLKASLARHEQQASERIRMAEAAAIADVRQRAIDLAMDMARQTLTNKIQGEAGAKLVDQAIAELPKTASANAKAA